MAYHHSAESVGYVVGKRAQVDIAQCFGRVVDDRERLVAVGAGVAVSREMLCYGEHSSGFKPARVGRAEAAYTSGVLAERAASDYRIVGTRVYVEHRSKHGLHAKQPALARYLAAIVVEEGVVVDAAECHVVGEALGILQAHCRAPLAVERDEKRHGRYRLSVVDQCGVLRGGAAAYQYSTDAIAVNVGLYDIFCRGQRARVEHGDEQLTYAVSQVESKHHAVDPCLAGLLLRRGKHGRTHGTGCRRE